MPTLISPVDDLRDAFVAMATEFADQGEPRYMVEAKDFSAYLAALRERERGEGLPAGWVSDSHFWLVDKTRILGCSRLRHRLTAALQREGGHIGYDVRPSERRKGYGTLLLRLTLERASALGITRVRVTCDADNSPSVRVIEKNGGVLDGEAVSARSGKVIRQYWIERAVPAAQPCIAADEASPGP
jgi:predicted acetyltransferase